MNRQNTLVVFYVMFALLCGRVSALEIERPAGGEVFVVGQTQYVRLSNKTRFKRIQIELTRDNGLTYALIGEIDNTKGRDQRNKLEFVIAGPASSQCRIRALGGDEGIALSGTFSIVAEPTIAATPTGPAGGDLTGTYPNPQISPLAVTAEKLSSSSASSGMILTANGNGGAGWQVIPSVTLVGDATGPASATVVERIRGVPLSTATPSDKNFLRYDALSGQWKPSAYADAAGGDLAGNYPAPTVSAVGGQSATNVASGAVLANAATSANTANAIVKRDANGAISAGVIESTSGGFKFPDATVQTTAIVGGGVPSGYIILGTTPTSPTGYTFTSKTIAEIWQSRSDMLTPRHSAVAATVNDRIFVISGNVSGTPSSINEEYNPLTDTWATKTPLPSARNEAAATSLNGKVYVAGGSNDTTPYQSTFEVYDPSTNLWSTLAPMQTGRSGLELVAVADKIYAIGGQNGGAGLTTVEEYDPTLNSWTTRASMSVGRNRFGAAVLNGQIYVFGGEAGTTTEEYNPLTDTWALKANLPLSLEENSGGSVNGKVYSVGGGGGSSESVFEYSPTANSWKTVPAKLIPGRSSFAMAIHNETLYAFGINANTKQVQVYGGLIYYLHRKN